MVAIFRVGSAVACAVVLTTCQSVTSPVGGTPPGRRDAASRSGRLPGPPYGARSDAPGAARTVALTFDDGPGKSTAVLALPGASTRAP